MTSVVIIVVYLSGLHNCCIILLTGSDERGATSRIPPARQYTLTNNALKLHTYECVWEVEIRNNSEAHSSQATIHPLAIILTVGLLALVSTIALEFLCIFYYNIPAS